MKSVAGNLVYVCLIYTKMLVEMKFSEVNASVLCMQVHQAPSTFELCMSCNF